MKNYYLCINSRIEPEDLDIELICMLSDIIFCNKDCLVKNNLCIPTKANKHGNKLISIEVDENDVTINIEFTNRYTCKVEQICQYLGYYESDGFSTSDNNYAHGVDFNKDNLNYDSIYGIYSNEYLKIHSKVMVKIFDLMSTLIYAGYWNKTN